MTPAEIKAIAEAVADILVVKLRPEIRAEVRAALGCDQTDISKLASLPLEERRAFARARRLEQKRAGK